MHRGHYAGTRGCSYKGRCQPARCQCVKAQEPCFCRDPSPRFVYDEQARLRADIPDNVPIYECNTFCSCDKTCANRVRHRIFSACRISALSIAGDPAGARVCAPAQVHGTQGPWCICGSAHPGQRLRRRFRRRAVESRRGSTTRSVSVYTVRTVDVVWNELYRESSGDALTYQYKLRFWYIGKPKDTRPTDASREPSYVVDASRAGNVCAAATSFPYADQPVCAVYTIRGASNHYACTHACADTA